MAKQIKHPVKVFKHPDTGHETRASLPVEQNRLRAQGYVEQQQKVVAKPTENKK